MKPNYIPKIDGLRAIAVIMVLLFHLEPEFFKGGFVGVDVFFVISGFVITNSLIRRFDGFTSPRQFLSDFYMRRVRRILPGLCFCLIGTFILVLLLVPSNPSKPFLEYMLTGIFAIFGFSNLLLARQSVDYFGDLTEFNPFLQTWSLGVEEQFYLIMPLLFVLSFMLNGKELRRSIMTMLLIVGALTTYSFASFLGDDIFGTNYFLITSRGWEISVGVLLALTMSLRKINFLDLKISQFIDLICILLLILCMFSHGKVFMILGVISALFICASRSNSRFLSNKYLLLIGKASFSIYLWHWPVIWLARWIGIQVENPLNMIILLVFIIFIGFLSYVYIENSQMIRQKAIYSSLLSITGPLALGLTGSLSSLGFLPAFYIGGAEFGNVDEIVWKISGQSYKSKNANLKQVTLVGNSHARHLLPALVSYPNSLNYNIVYREVDTENYDNKFSEKNEIVQIVKNASNGDTILISSYFGRLDGAHSDELLKDELNKWRVFLEEIVLAASNSSANIIFADNVNKFESNFGHYQMCENEWFRAGRESCESRRIIPRSILHARVGELVSDFSLRSTALLYLDLGDEFCAELASRNAPCSNMLEGRMLYRDSNHLTSVGSILLSPVLARMIDGV